MVTKGNYQDQNKMLLNLSNNDDSVIIGLRSYGQLYPCFISSLELPEKCENKLNNFCKNNNNSLRYRIFSMIVILY